MRKGKIHDKIFAILFHFPSFCLYTVFLILPLVASFFIALLKWNGVGDSVFVGLDNFLDIFLRDRYFKKIIANTLISMGAGVFIQLPLALILAYMVYRVKKGFRFFQTSYFVPVVISATVIGLMFSLFFNPTFGPINTFLKAVGMEKYIKNWLSDPDIVLFSVILPGIWQYLGYHFVILLAGMQSIPSEIIESARIDGANTVDIFSKIVIPNVKSMIQVCIIINLSGAIKTFDIPYMMTQGGPGASSTFLAIYMYKEAFVDSSIGRGTAIAVCMLIMAVLATAVVNKIFAYINRKEKVKLLQSEVKKLKKEKQIDYKSNYDSEKYSKSVRNVLSYIEENYHQDISLESAATEVFMNKNYLSSLFCNEMGVGFTKYLSDFRLKKAKILLRETELNINEIANMTGFATANYFVRVFKKQENCTPKEYRIMEERKLK